ncbi:MAG: alanine racemase [Proteocatella sp.]
MNNFMPTWAEINLDNILHNYRSLKALTKEGTMSCAIIKANGYGHGSVELAKVLEADGCDYFGVATANEALELRNNGIKTPIMCLAYIEESLYGEFIEREMDIPLFSYQTAKKVSDRAVELGKKARIQVKLDTGMSRVGFQCNDETIEEIAGISQLPNLVLQGIFTHFAKADEWDRTETDLQYSKYDMVVSAIEKKGIQFNIKHVCNSAGTIMYPEYHLDMVRMGISLYGHYPSDEVDKERISLKPAMALKTKITHVKLLEEGRGVGYGHKHVVKDGSEYIATMPIGYADGFTRMLNGKVDVLINEKLFNLAGSICMDQSMILVDETVSTGDIVTIFSDDEEIRVERLAKRLGTINYEILCMVQRRIPRLYTRNGEIYKTVNYLLD